MRPRGLACLVTACYAGRQSPVLRASFVAFVAFVPKTSALTAEQEELPA